LGRRISRHQLQRSPMCRACARPLAPHPWHSSSHSSRTSSPPHPRRSGMDSSNNTGEELGHRGRITTPRRCRTTRNNIPPPPPPHRRCPRCSSHLRKTCSRSSNAQVPPRPLRHRSRADKGGPHRFPPSSFPPSLLFPLPPPRLVVPPFPARLWARMRRRPRSPVCPRSSRPVGRCRCPHRHCCPADLAQVPRSNPLRPWRARCPRLRASRRRSRPRWGLLRVPARFLATTTASAPRARRLLPARSASVTLPTTMPCPRRAPLRCVLRTHSARDLAASPVRHYHLACC